MTDPANDNPGKVVEVIFSPADETRERIRGILGAIADIAGQGTDQITGLAVVIQTESGTDTWDHAGQSRNDLYASVAALHDDLRREIVEAYD